MKKVSIYELKSLYRDDMKIYGWKFGSGEKSAVIAGGIRGNEIQQMFTCARLIKSLKEIEKEGKISDGKSILVVPVINPCSMNIEKRFWPTDNTDINRMFPGYNLGETTQRIASGVFSEISGYKYGIQFASNYIPGEFVPHVRIMTTGYEDVESAKSFGFPYIVLRKPHLRTQQPCTTTGRFGKPNPIQFLPTRQKPSTRKVPTMQCSMYSIFLTKSKSSNFQPIKATFLR